MSIRCSMHGLSARICVQCHLHHRSPRAAILRFPFECVDFFSAPFLDVVQPLSLSSSLPPSFQTSPPAPAYCPLSCICVQTGLASFPRSVAPCSSCITLCCTLPYSVN